MASAKSVFERPVASDSSPKLSKKASKWDKPKSLPPPAVNRDDADNIEQAADDSELPPPAYTKNMLAKFQSLQQSDGLLVKDCEVNPAKPRKQCEGEQPCDKMSGSPQDATNDTDASGPTVVTNVPDDDAEHSSSCIVSESPLSDEGQKCDADPKVSVASEVAEPASNAQKCLINFDDDVDASGPAAGSDADENSSAAGNDAGESSPAAGNDVDDDADHSGPAAGSDANKSGPAAGIDVDDDPEADIPSSCPSQDLVDADAVASDEHTSIPEGSTGEM